MKCSLTITDISLDQAQNIVQLLTGGANAPVMIPSTIQPHNIIDTDEEPESGSNVNGVFDAEGMPWDKRIHSSSKKITAKGIWNRRKGVPEDTFLTITNEIRANQQPAQPHYAPQPVQPVQQPQYAPQPIQPQYQQPVQPVQPQYAPQPVQPVAPPAGRDFNALLTKISQMFQKNAAEATTYVNSLTQRLSQAYNFQVNSMNDISARPDMIDFSFQLLAADGK